MTRKLSLSILRLFSITVGLLEEAQRFGRRLVLPKVSLIAENLFLRKQLAFYLERNVKPQRLTDSARLLLLFWSRWFDWRNALVVVKPETLIAWQRRAFLLFWRWKCRGLCGRPRLPKDLRVLISEMVRENPTWGQARVAAELSLKLGISVSPRTVRAYWPEELEPNRSTSQRWTTFIRNHARVIIACDFVVTVTARLRILYIFVVMEIGSRKLLHVNVTPHPSASWTLQQLREAIPGEHAYRWLVHDRSGIFSGELDKSLQAWGVMILKTPGRAPKANAFCERVIGSLRRECLDWFIPLNEKHVRTLVREWAAHYNHGRPHTNLGPGIPDPPLGLPVERQIHRHEFPQGFLIKKQSILGGLHHEYRLEKIAA